MPFRKLHAGGEFEGADTGLAICRKIVERYGWGITARKNPGKESTLVINLPSKQQEG